MLNFKSYTDSELEAMRNFELLPKGEYPFKVISLDQKISNAGNEMLVAKLQVVAGEESRIIRDYIVIEGMMSFKFKHFLQSIGMEMSYKEEKLDPQYCVNRCGTLLLDIDKGKIRPDGSSNYPDKNVVTDYIKIEIDPELKEVFEDKIPF